MHKCQLDPYSFFFLSMQMWGALTSPKSLYQNNCLWTDVTNQITKLIQVSRCFFIIIIIICKVIFHFGQLTSCL